MKQNVGITIAVLFMSLIFTACNKTPSTTIINNEEIEISTDEKPEEIDVEELPVVTMREETIVEEWLCGDIAVRVNGTKMVPDTLKGLYMYEVEVNDHIEYEENMKFLFGDYEDLIEGDVGEIMRVICPDESYSASLINTCYYADSNIREPNCITFVGNLSPVTEDMRRVNMTEEEAKSRTEEIIERIGLTGFEFGGIRYWEEHQQITPEGTLAAYLGDKLLVLYHQKLQGVPLLSVIGDDYLEPMIRVEYDSRGVYFVTLAEYFCEPYAEIEECISYEIAVEKVKEYISKNKDYQGATFDKVIFEYSIVQEYVNGEFIKIAVPSWHFYIQRDYTYSSWGFVDFNDIVINGLDGSVREEIQSWLK